MKIQTIIPQSGQQSEHLYGEENPHSANSRHSSPLTAEATRTNTFKSQNEQQTVPAIGANCGDHLDAEALRVEYSLRVTGAGEIPFDIHNRFEIPMALHPDHILGAYASFEGVFKHLIEVPLKVAVRSFLQHRFEAGCKEQQQPDMSYQFHSSQTNPMAHRRPHPESQDQVTTDTSNGSTNSHIDISKAMSPEEYQKVKEFFSGHPELQRTGT